MNSTPISPVSPCIGVCRLDANNVCQGCYRSLEEIAQWTRMSVAERQKAIEASDSRRPKVG